MSHTLEMGEHFSALCEPVPNSYATGWGDKSDFLPESRSAKPLAKG